MAETPTVVSDNNVAELSPLSVPSDLQDSEQLVERQTHSVDNLETAEQETTEDTDDAESVRSSIAENRRYPLRERRNHSRTGPPMFA